MQASHSWMSWSIFLRRKSKTSVNSGGLYTYIIYIPTIKTLTVFCFPRWKGWTFLPHYGLCKTVCIFSRVHCKKIALLDCWLHVHRCLCCQLSMLSRKQHPLKGFQQNFSSRPHTFSLQGSFYHPISLEQEGFKTRKKWMRKSVIPIIHQMKISPSVSLALFNYAWI